MRSLPEHDIRLFGKLACSAVSGLMRFPEQGGSCALKPVALPRRHADPSSSRANTWRASHPIDIKHQGKHPVPPEMVSVGRKRVDGAAVPACPRGHAPTDVVRAGTYGPRDANKNPVVGKQRQLWWCRPADGTNPHRFSERLPRTRLVGDGHACAECETHLAVFEGPQHARHYEFAARVVAQVLVAAGNGTSYRAAARTARSGARPKHWPVPARFGANGTLAGDWVAAFAPVVCEPVLAGESWPEVVCLDETWFGSTMETTRRRKRQALWVVWGAFAHSSGREPGRLFRLGCSGKLDGQAAAAWLSAVPGRPRFVVCDGTKLWPKAVALAWPQVIDPDTGEILAETPTIVPCEWHLRDRLTSVLRQCSVLPPRDAGEWRAPAPSGFAEARRRTLAKNRSELRIRAAQPDWYAQTRVAISRYDDPDNHPLVVAGRKAFWHTDGWDELRALAEKWGAGHLVMWMDREAWIRDYLENRDPRLPRSIGGLEANLRKVKLALKPRAHVLRNTVRTQRLLDLMTLHLRGADQADAYAARIRAHLEANHGGAPAQRAGITGGAHLH